MKKTIWITLVALLTGYVGIWFLGDWNKNYDISHINFAVPDIRNKDFIDGEYVLINYDEGSSGKYVGYNPLTNIFTFKGDFTEQPRYFFLNFILPADYYVLSFYDYIKNSDKGLIFYFYHLDDRGSNYTAATSTLLSDYDNINGIYMYQTTPVDMSVKIMLNKGTEPLSYVPPVLYGEKSYV